MLDVHRIASHPLFHELVTERTRLSRGLAVTMAAAYFGYVLCIAFRPHLLGTPLADGWTTSWGIVIGVAIIALGFALTAVYVGYANARFDTLSRRLQEDVQ
jgi:uncharacterized membrane protein (DUF485 family)